MNNQLCTVSDVYDHAAAIGKDIEIIVQEYGKETIEDVMPKIVFVLEQLEGLAEKNEQDRERIAALMLEREKHIIHANRDQAIQRQLEEKLAYMESLVSKDKKELEKRLKTLETENEYLMEELEKRDNEIVKERTNGALPGDIEVMVRMKTTIDDQRDQIRSQKHELHSQRNEIEGLAEQINRLGNINAELRQSSSPKSSESKSSLSDPPHETSIHSDTENTDQQCNTSLLDELKSQDASFNEQNTNDSSFTEISTTSICLTSDESSTPVVDEQTKKKDPNRPRYTLKEMQSLLEERNTYKIQMMALEEELQLYKGGEENLLKAQSQSAPVNVNDLGPKQSGVRSFMQKFLGK